MTRFIMAALSVTQLIYLSESGAVMLGTKMDISLLDLFILLSNEHSSHYQSSYSPHTSFSCKRRPFSSRTRCRFIFLNRILKNTSCCKIACVLDNFQFLKNIFENDKLKLIILYIWLLVYLYSIFLAMYLIKFLG